MSKTKQVLLYVEGFRITGKLCVDEGFRLSDHVNTNKSRFLSLIEVEIATLTGEVIAKEDFLCVNKDKIIMIKDEGAK